MATFDVEERIGKQGTGSKFSKLGTGGKGVPPAKDEEVMFNPLANTPATSTAAETDVEEGGEKITRTTSEVYPDSKLVVHGVAAGPDAEMNIIRLLSQFSDVKEVVVRERQDVITGADTSWALVTMATTSAADTVLLNFGSRMASKLWRLDPDRPVRVERFSVEKADQSTAAMTTVGIGESVSKDDMTTAPTDGELSDLTYAFQAVDMDGGQYIDLNELSLMLEVMGCEVSKEQVQSIITQAKAGFAEWVETKDNETLARCSDVWKNVDTDNSGSLGPKEIASVISNLRSQGFRVKAFSKSAMTDGRVDFKEFSDWFIGQDGFSTDFGTPPAKGRGAKACGALAAQAPRIGPKVRFAEKMAKKAVTAPVKLLKKSVEVMAAGLGLSAEAKARQMMRNPQHLIFAEFVFMMRSGILKQFLSGPWQARARKMSELREAFDTADIDGNNLLKISELELVVRAMNARVADLKTHAIRQVWAVLNPGYQPSINAGGLDAIPFSLFVVGMLKVRDDPALANIVRMDVPNRFALLSLLIDSPINKEQEKLIFGKMNVLEKFGVKVLQQVADDAHDDAELEKDKDPYDVAVFQDKVSKACDGRLHFLTDEQRQKVQVLHRTCVMQAFLIGLVWSIVPGLVENFFFWYFETDGVMEAHWTCPGTDNQFVAPSVMVKPYVDLGIPSCPFGTCPFLPAYSEGGGSAAGTWMFDEQFQAETGSETCASSSWPWCDFDDPLLQTHCVPLRMTHTVDEQRFFLFNIYNLIAIIGCVVCELSLLMYTAVKSAVLVSEALELRLTPLNEDRARVGRMLVQTVFEIPDPEGKAMGVDSEADKEEEDIGSILHNFFAAVWYKGKTFITGQILLLILEKIIAYEYLIFLRPYLAAGVATVFWDTVACHQIMNRAERRAVGVTTAIEVFNDIMDTFCPMYEQDPTTLSEIARTQILRAIGVGIVVHGSMHPTMELLLGHAVEYLDMKQSPAVQFGGVIDNHGDFINDLAKISLAERRAVLCVHMLGYVLGGSIGKEESRLWDTLMQEAETLHQIERQQLERANRKQLRGWIVEQAPELRADVDAVPVAEDDYFRLCDEGSPEANAELITLRKLFAWPMRMTINDAEQDGLIPRYVCQKFRYNEPLTTTMLRACFEAEHNQALRREISKRSFYFNEFTFHVMRLMMYPQ